MSVKTIWEGQARALFFSFLLLTLIGLIIGFVSNAGAFTLSVVGPNGEQVNGYRWLVEEDATIHPSPGVPGGETLAVNFHRSYMPVVASGDNTNASNIDVDPAKYYYVSVLPNSGYTIGGARVTPGQDTVVVTVNALPLPTAQITVFAFEDNSPINNAPDLPEERGLEGFSIILEDAAGRYGQAGGQVMTDAFGNPLGTEYNPDGTVAKMGDGTILTDANGLATIKYLSPGKYGVQVVPPAGQGWQQTSTIEGTRVIDAWVKPNEPAFFSEFGPPGFHVFVGFIKPMVDAAVLNGANTISGRVVNLHLSRPPNYTFEKGVPFKHTRPWVGLNDLATGIGRGVYAQECNADGTFSIPNVPPGNYQLVIWDDSLDLIFASLGVTVPAGGGDLNLGDIPVFQWFTGLYNYVFYDANENGFLDPGEQPIPGVTLNLRFRDGTIYQSAITNPFGFAPFYETFPFFNWLVAEVDFARFKATGATVIVDGGGPINPADPWSFGGVLNPQMQPDPNNPGQFLPYRIETGPVLLEAFQGFLGQTSVIQWGKKDYGPGENGGITGIVYYATTRAEDDPRRAAAEPWEPGIPRVQVNLYRDSDGNGIIDDLDGDGQETLADVDNFPFASAQRPFPGPEDVDRDSDGQFDQGDAIQITHTDSWDDNLPTNCPGDPNDPFYLNGKCYDGLRNFNQVRPGVFDGGYAFDGLQPGTYIVEAVPPKSPFGKGYEIVKEEDKNVDFGDTYRVAEQLFVPVCVGDPHVVPQELTLFPGIDAPFARQTRPLCDRKQVILTDGQNAAADFFMFTKVPIAGHIVGMILDDLANEFDPNSPQFGEKYAPPFIPISIRDWTGREISRVYSDEFGTYNALVPSTYTTDRPSPSGVAPNMITVCLNDPGPIPDPNNPGSFITDPFFNRQYSQFCYTFQYMPGTTTYLDTPLLPIAAFAGANQFPLDCEFPDGTPKIYSVSAPGSGGGPYVNGPGETITIVSEGIVQVPNPEYDGLGGTKPKTIARDYGFGNVPGTVTVGGSPLVINTWTPGTITATVPVGATTGELVVERGDNGNVSPLGVTLTVGPISEAVWRVSAGGSIQNAIDLARPGDLVLVGPGSYEEMVIMWKPVRLQGWGPGSTTISAIKSPAEKLQAWRDKIKSLINAGAVDLLPGQGVGFGGIEPVTLFNEEGAGVTVLSKNVDITSGGFGLVGGLANARVDGFTITGADVGGGIFVNGYAHYLQITNNRIVGNQGALGGGIRIGHPNLVAETPLGLQYQSSFNDHITIAYNHITENGALAGAGGGVSLCSGADNYRVEGNFICGNISLGSGGGVGHLGKSDGGTIANNLIVFNQSFNQGQSVTGGGIFIGGGAPLGGPGSLSPGTGNVTIEANLIQGNLAGAGDGGGIHLAQINGQDIAASTDPATWYTINLFDNMIVNNISGLAGGGIALQDAVRVNLIHNTIANNDSTATAGEAFQPGNPNQSTPQPAGIISRGHSAALQALFASSGITLPLFSSPQLVNDIVWHNRSFYFQVDTTQTPPAYLLVPNATRTYWDLGVLGAPDPAADLDPQYCIITTGYTATETNMNSDPLFVSEYFNGARSTILMIEPTTGIQPAPAFDEGGNFIDLHFGPLSLFNPATGDLFGDYHITAFSPAIGAGDTAVVSQFAELAEDFDGDTRTVADGVDIGADEYTGLPACFADLDGDKDVDGADLAMFIQQLIAGTSTIDIATFAGEFGRIDCP